MKYRFNGIDCSNCCSRLEEKLKKNEKIKNINMSYTTKTMIIELKENISINEIEKIAQKYENNFKIEENSDFEYGKELDNLNEKRLYMYVALGLFFIAVFIDKILYWYLKIDSDLKLYFTPMYIIVYLLVGLPVIRDSVILAKKGNIFNEKILMSVSTIAAIFLRDYPEAAGVMIFYTLGEYFQELSILKSRKGIRKLLDNKIDKVHIFDEKNNELIDKNIEEIEIDDIIYVKAGERIEFDGVIYSENVLLDTSLITGESMPREFKKGDDILAGYINLNSPISLKVNKRFENSYINKIIEMVENSSNNKSNIERFVTKFSRYYTPLVFMLAIFTILIIPIFFPRIEFKDALYNGITLLVISCPCALVLSVPLTYFSGVTRAAKSGILIKSSSIFDGVYSLDKVFLDKTGTITEGKFKVSSVYENLKYTNISIKDIYKYVYAVEKNSNHPVAKSITEFISKKYSLINFENNEEFYEYLSLCEHCGCCHKYSSHFENKATIRNHEAQGHFVGDMCDDHIHVFLNQSDNYFNFENYKNIKEHNRIEFNDVEVLELKEVLGKGISAKIGNDNIIIGSKRIMEESQVNLENIGNNIEKYKNSNVVYVSINNIFVLAFVIKDIVKSDSKLAINEMKKNGIKEIIMLTGDNIEVASEVSENLGIDRYYSDLLPEDKLEIVKKENYEMIFIGDGINDAPSLANAKVGIAMGKAGQDIAIDVADVVFTGDSLRKVSELKKLSVIIKRIIIQNITIILTIKLIVILLGMFSFVSMWLAVLADVGVTMIAVLNSMRVRKVDLK